MARLLKILFISLCAAWSLQLGISTAQAVDHPLRPYPFQLTPEEERRQITDPDLTPFCASRPTLVETITIDQREPVIHAAFSGTLYSDFSSFTTPLLSITDSNNPDINLSYAQKAKRYLADFLEGRAYYEGKAEPEYLSLSQQFNVYNPLGVFRQLATQEEQDRLKRTLIQRALGTFSLDHNLYGFTPASLTIHNYTVAYWKNNRVVDHQTPSSQKITLTDFANHWAPLAEEFQSLSEYQQAYDNWKQSDNQKWFKLWPYVPMFSREDTKGFIQSIPEPGQQSNTITTQEVIHPHLARTYEVSSAIANLLSPQSTQQYQPPSFSSFYTPAPWATDPWWLESDQSVPADLDPLCQPPNISSSGDQARNSAISSTINKSATIEQTPNTDCEITEEDPLTGNPVVVNDTNCFKEQQIRFSPVYYKTYTPFLDQIAFNLAKGPGALFSIFEPGYQPSLNWAGAASDDDPNPRYGYTQGGVEVGFKQPSNQAKFFYKQLGEIHCLKEKLIASLQPYIPGMPYRPFAKECDLGFYPFHANVCPIPSGSYNPNPVQVNMAGVKNRFIDLANRWVAGGDNNPRIDKYETVVNDSIARGIDPIFTLAIWLHESGASNYKGVCRRHGGNPNSPGCQRLQDFGYNIAEIETVIDVNGNIIEDHFNDQFCRFLNLPGYYLSVCKDEMQNTSCPMEIFMAMYTPSGQCTPNKGSNKYLKKIQKIYSWLAPQQTFPCYPISLP